MALKNSQTADLQRRDNAHYLHPFTDYKALHEEGARIIRHAEGVYQWDTDGNKFLDGLAGLGCVNIGYGRPELPKVAADAMQKLSFCQSFFKTSNEPAIELAQTLVDLTPAGLNHAFFQSSGSEANETAIRLALHYWDLMEQPNKKLIIARENAYHGSTMLTAGLSGIPPMHHAGGELPFVNIRHIRAPYHYVHGANQTAEAFGITAARWLEEKILELGAENVAVFLAEPLQGAGGAIIPPESYWPEVQRICKQYNILLAVDEVVCGFGRTGEWFGSDSFGIEGMDFMQMAKGLTSAYIPMSATMVSDRVAEVLIDRGEEWWHGFTYSGHPVCCAVALENIRIIREEGLLEKVRTETGPLFAAHVHALGDHALVGDVRSRGLFAGLQLVKDKATRTLFEDHEMVGEYCSQVALSNGLALRDIGNTNALMPPLTIAPEQIEFVFDVTRKSLDETARHFGLM